ncbi:hypothetical protein LN42_03890 [Marinitoga sp. 1137]|uniref:GGDEF domain-containing response regulator n=1 Tax=Marinitoga sp. 1137 TaxID=1545835 RepID=UPI0009505760|nr:diguanylate cyclase [Marinitoga sp. 1137]APT75628.1 hypothetical protein LN42_03890 [Marinitoga sp. 1137]
MNILVVEDSKLERLYLKDFFNKFNYNVLVASDGYEALEIHNNQNIDLMVLDLIMPGISGFEVCEEIRKKENNSDHYTYIIMLTGRTDKEDIIKGLEIGADDYVIKPFDENELRVRISVGERIVSMYKKILELNKKLEYESTHDDLTKIYNRKEIYSRLKNELSNNPIIAILDLDFFKKINDTYGHLAGNYVLSEFAKIVKEIVGDFGEFGRFGGEEFLIFFKGNILESQALEILEKIRNIIYMYDFNFEGQSIKVTVSIGATRNNGQYNIDQILAIADDNLYEAKKEGRNRIIYK